MRTFITSLWVIATLCGSIATIAGAGTFYSGTYDGEWGAFRAWKWGDNMPVSVLMIKTNAKTEFCIYASWRRKQMLTEGMPSEYSYTGEGAPLLKFSWKS